MQDNSDLLLNLNPSSGTPIYRQLMEQLRRMIVSGQLEAGSAVPSVRRLAERLEVNPMTISKAYSLLEVEGLLAHQRGKNMIVASGWQKAWKLEKRMQMLEPILEDVITQSRQLNISKDQILKRFRKLLGEDNE